MFCQLRPRLTNNNWHRSWLMAKSIWQTTKKNKSCWKFLNVCVCACECATVVVLIVVDILFVVVAVTDWFMHFNQPKCWQKKESDSDKKSNEQHGEREKLKMVKLCSFAALMAAAATGSAVTVTVAAISNWLLHGISHRLAHRHTLLVSVWKHWADTCCSFSVCLLTVCLHLHILFASLKSRTWELNHIIFWSQHLQILPWYLASKKMCLFSLIPFFKENFKRN